MSATDLKLVAARAEVVVARKRFTDTLTELQHRIDPRVMARETAQSITARVTAAGYSAAREVGRHPLLICGAAVMAGASLVLARRKRPAPEKATQPTSIT